jgi:phosphoribosylanthranilate isomerase
VAVEVKFCGLTRREDARQVGPLGGRYAGVIFAGGPRQVDPSTARAVFAELSAEVLRVGVFAGQSPAEIAKIAGLLELQVIQLHGDPQPDIVRRMKDATGAMVWAVVRVLPADDPGDIRPARAGRLAERVAELDGVADAVLLDALVAGRLGGTGHRFDWTLAGGSARPRVSRLVAAGGLAPDTVAEAITALRPHVVDVSSGVEAAPGVKDHERMRAFAEAVRRAAGET